MLARLFVGIIKGLLVGTLLGFGVLQLNLAWAVMPAWLAYIAAPLAGVVVGLIAGKPIWAKDAKIEAGMKATVGAILGAGLMFVARTYLTMALPAFALKALAITTPVALGMFPMASLAIIAALLGGFYEADNTPEPEGEAKKAEGAEASSKAGEKKRIAAAPQEDEFEDELGDEAEQKKAKK